ncbi:hypothetical protein GGX14DRAFT_407355 [Mycena pura]|uniref:Uncharacterized protein n=1 Tax=Mycena pura TaxID=153505 RepID=A0AAD6USG9_9AGAR|nr:hypothetical protein GGX14DRAFT_407355 [Mycena pura]
MGCRVACESETRQGRGRGKVVLGPLEVPGQRHAGPAGRGFAGEFAAQLTNNGDFVGGHAAQEIDNPLRAFVECLALKKHAGRNGSKVLVECKTLKKYLAAARRRGRLLGCSPGSGTRAWKATGHRVTGPSPAKPQQTGRRKLVRKIDKSAGLIPGQFGSNKIHGSLGYIPGQFVHRLASELLIPQGESLGNRTEGIVVSGHPSRGFLAPKRIHGFHWCRI